MNKTSILSCWVALVTIGAMLTGDGFAQDDPLPPELHIQDGIAEILRSGTTLSVSQAQSPIELQFGDEVHLGPMAYAVVIVGDALKTLSGGDVWKVQILPSDFAADPQKEGGVFRALFRWKPTEDSDVAASMGDEDSDSKLRLVATFPAHHSTIHTDRPHFVWNAADSIFEVSIVHGEELLFRTIVEGRNHLAFPAKLNSLQSGETYYWEIRDRGDLRRSDSSSFAVVNLESRTSAADRAESIRETVALGGLQGDLAAIVVAGHLHQEGLDQLAIEELIHAASGGTSTPELQAVLHQLIGGLSL